MINKFYEGICVINLSEDIHFTNMHEVISKLISKAMFNKPELKKLHEENVFKPYSFSLPSPVEIGGVYLKGRIYYFKLRAIDLSFILSIKQSLSQMKDGISVISMDIKEQQYRFINELCTITPAVSVLENRCWVKEDGLELLKEKIHSNIVKKLKAVDKNFEEPLENFIEYLEMTNRKPLKINYKGIILLGNKFKIGVKSDAVSQSCAFMAIANNLLEKASLGCGFCAAK